MNYKTAWNRLKFTAETIDLVDMERADFLKSLIKMIETAEEQDRDIESVIKPIDPYSPYYDSPYYESYYKTAPTCETKEGTDL